MDSVGFASCRESFTPGSDGQEKGRPSVDFPTESLRRTLRLCHKPLSLRARRSKAPPLVSGLPKGLGLEALEVAP
jgi:hypothetical protein